MDRLTSMETFVRVVETGSFSDEQLNASESRTGWTVGGGIEWAFWNNWSAKVEYDHDVSEPTGR